MCERKRARPTEARGSEDSDAPDHRPDERPDHGKKRLSRLARTRARQRG